MAGWRPVKQRDFIHKPRALGFTGPFSGTRHQFLPLGQQRQTIPSNAEFSIPQVRMLVRQVESILARSVPLDEWESL